MNHPCPPGDPKWYAGRSNEVLSIGPCDTKQEAVEEALHAGDFNEIDPDDERPYWRAGVYVGKYRPRHVDLSRYFDADEFIDRAADRMEDEDGPDEDGERHPVEQLTRDDIQSLGDYVRKAIWQWQHDRQIELRSYWLDAYGGADFVMVPHPDNE